MKRFRLGTLFLFAAVLAAQAQEPAAAVQVTPEADTTHLSGEAPSLATQSDPNYSNVLFGSASLGAAFDTQGYTNANGSLSSDVRFFAQPSIAFRQTFPTANWTLSYTPGVSVSRREADTALFTHNLAGDGVWNPSPRLALHARQDYSISTNPFESVGRVALLPDLGGYFGPNYNGVIPGSKRTSLVSNADVNYRLTAHSAIGITGGYQQYNYDNVDNTQAGSAAFINSTIVNGSVYVSDRISRRQTLGVQLAYTDIYSYGAQQSRVQAPALLLFDTVRLTQHSLLTVFAGPEYSRSSAVVPLIPPTDVLQRDWHPALGATYTWTGTQDALTLQFSRRISSGGGLMNANVATFGSVGFRSRLTRRWTADARLSVDNEDAIDVLNQSTYLRTLWAGGGLTREVSRNFSVRLDGAYVWQTGAGLGSVPGTFAPGNHELVQITVDYHFLKGLGR